MGPVAGLQPRFLVAWAQLDEAFSLASRDPEAAARMIASAEEHPTYLPLDRLLAALHPGRADDVGLPRLGGIREGTHDARLVSLGLARLCPFVSPLLQRLFARDSAGRFSVRARWWLYYGSFAIAGMACGSLWHGLTHALLGTGLSWGVDVFWGAFIGDFTALFAEQLSRYVQLARVHAGSPR